MKLVALETLCKKEFPKQLSAYGEQATYRALFRDQERLSAKKEGQEERSGLII